MCIFRWILWCSGHLSPLSALSEVLPAEHFAELYRFATETSSFTKMDYPYIGAYLPRVAFPLIRRITEAMAAALPRVFARLPLHFLWSYKSRRA